MINFTVFTRPAGFPSSIKSLRLSITASQWAKGLRVYDDQAYQILQSSELDAAFASEAKVVTAKVNLKSWPSGRFILEVIYIHETF